MRRFMRRNFLAVIFWSLMAMAASEGCQKGDTPSNPIADFGRARDAAEVQRWEICNGSARDHTFWPEDGLAQCWCSEITGQRYRSWAVLFDYVNGKEVFDVPYPGKWGGGQLSPDKTRMIQRSADDDRSLSLRETVTGRELHLFQPYQDRIWDMAWLPDGKRFVTVGRELPVYVWNAEARDRKSERIGAFMGHRTHYPFCLAVSIDGKQVATASLGRVFVWDPGTQKTIREFVPLIAENHPVPYQDPSLFPGPREDDVLTMAFFPDGRRLAVATISGNVIVLDIETGNEVMRYAQPGGVSHDDIAPHWHIPNSIPLAVSTDGRRILYSMYAQPARLLDATTGEIIATMHGHTRRARYDTTGEGPGGISALAFTPDGVRAVTGGEDGTIRLWKLPD